MKKILSVVDHNADHILWSLTKIRSTVSAIHVCLQHHILAHTFLPVARFFFCWHDFFAGVNFFSAGATFFCWCDFLLLVLLFFASATFFRSRDLFFLARLFPLALICRPLVVLLRAQSTNMCSCEQDG